MGALAHAVGVGVGDEAALEDRFDQVAQRMMHDAVSYTHLRAHETVLDLVCRLLLEKKKHQQQNS